MELNPLVKKLHIKPATRVLVINPPENYLSILEPLPRETQVTTKPDGTYDVVQLFIKNSTELERDLIWLQQHLRSDTIFWITYPKKSSGIKSDLEMTRSWEETVKYGLQVVASAAIDQTWTALRFRPDNQVKKSQVGNSEIQKNDYGSYIDVENRIVTTPEDLERALQKNEAALAFFNKLAYSHKKEYVIWILSAKQEKTRDDRISKTIDKLLSHKKNPADK